MAYQYIQAKYRNHTNEELNIGIDGLFMTNTTLYDYKWSYSADNNMISAFNRGIVTKNVTVAIACGSEAEGKTIANHLMEIAEVDVFGKEAGKIIIGDYYFKCYIIGMKINEYIKHNGFILLDLEILSDYPAWIKEYTNDFDGAGGLVGGKNLDFSYDFSYDFTSANAITNLINPSFFASDFRLIIFGEISNPKIFIGNHEYSLSGCSASSVEYIVIDSKEKTIYKVKNDGTQDNLFQYRNKDSYIFEKIPSGDNAVTWDGDVKFQIVLIEERSEPKWI